jgi:site-specific DNA-methyltransferase (adenine-specific)
MMNKLICGDCLEVLPTLPKAKMIWADPPDNLGVKYVGVSDKRKGYLGWLSAVMRAGATNSDVFWLSYYYKYQMNVLNIASRSKLSRPHRQFIWRFTFGQHRHTDCGNGYRPILRLMRPGAKLYPDAIRVESARQKMGDKRADPRGRVPDDVWEFPRVCGTHKERKKWIPNQHPKDLLRRMVLFSTEPGDLVIDMFAGSGNMLEVCYELKRDCIGIDISSTYCKHIRENLRKLK